MDNASLGSIVIAILAVGLFWVVSTLLRRRFHDEIFAGTIPGQFPPPGSATVRERLSTPEYAGEVAVQFHPPVDASPGLAGAIVDGTPAARHVTAVVVDLAVRGWLTMTLVGADGEPLPSQVDAKTPKDWRLTRNADVVGDALSPLEASLLARLFADGAEVRLKQSPHLPSAMEQTRQDLGAATMGRGWYQSGSTVSGSGLLTGAGIVGGGLMALQGGLVPILSGAAIAAGGIVGAHRSTARPIRTAEGTATRIQALGFRKYLDTAEADQIRFEEAAEIFSRYLPYAIAFGVTEHWATVFGEVAARAQSLGYAGDGFELTWLDAWIVGDLVSDGINLLLLGDLLGDGVLLDGIGDLVGELAGVGGDVVGVAGELASELGDGIGGIADGIGDALGDFFDGL